MTEKRKELEFAGDDFNYCNFEELEKDEYYLVFLKEHHGEKAIVVPSLAWLDCPLTYCEPGDIDQIKKVKGIKTYKPKVSPKNGGIKSLIQ